MADQFNAKGLPAVAVSADTPRDERRQALQALAAGEIRVVFSVDLFNEGIDVPSVDTLLLLRPTDSPTVLLQQLGRGLRREANKSICTVLDFVGHHHKEFRRSEEHTSELQSLMRISYAVFCLKKKTKRTRTGITRKA